MTTDSSSTGSKNPPSPKVPTPRDIRAARRSTAPPRPSTTSKTRKPFAPPPRSNRGPGRPPTMRQAPSTQVPTTTTGNQNPTSPMVTITNPAQTDNASVHSGNSISPSLQRQAQQLDTLFAQDNDWTSEPLPEELEQLFQRMNYTSSDISLAQSLNLTSIDAFIEHGIHDVASICSQYARRDLCNERFQNMLIRAAVLGSYFHDISHDLQRRPDISPDLAIPSDSHHTNEFLSQFLNFTQLKEHFRATYPSTRQEYLDYIDEYASPHSLVGSEVGSTRRSLARHHGTRGGSTTPSVNSDITTPSKQSRQSSKQSRQSRLSKISKASIHEKEVEEIPDNTHAFVPTPDFTKIREEPQTVMTNDVQAGLELLGKLQNGLLSAPKTPRAPQRKACPPLSKDTTWNNRLEDFPKFKGKFRGHYMQASRGYLFRKDFLAAYLEEGYDCWIKFPEDIHSEQQLREDSMSLLGGLLVSTSECNSGKEILKRYEAQGDGIRAWYEYDKKFNSDGHKDIRIRKLEQVISQVFHKGYKGGLARWISDYESAFAELVELQTEDGTRSTWEDDATKKRRLFQNAVNTGVPPTIMEEIAKDKDFSEAAMLLRKHALIQNDENRQNAARNVHQLNNEYEKEPGYSEALICKLAKVPFPLWSTLNDDVKKWLIAERMRLNNEEKQGKRGDVHQDNQANPKDDNSKDKHRPNLPSQYSRSHQVQQQMDEEDDISSKQVDEFLAQAMMSYTHTQHDDPEDYRNVVVTRSSHVPDHSESVARIMHSIALENNQQVALSDNGSDSTVIGKIWYIMSEEAFRTASLSGLYDFVLGKRLPIVSGIAACDLPNHQTVILQVDEAIYDKDLNHTILSEFQMREAGVTVDSTAKRHGGNQTITIRQNEEDIEIPLTLSCALMYLTLRRPTQEEIRQVEAQELHTFKLTTGSKPWKPSKYSDSESQRFLEEVLDSSEALEMSADPALIHSSSAPETDSHQEPLSDTIHDGPEQCFDDTTSQHSEFHSLPDMTCAHSQDTSSNSEDTLFYYDPSDEQDTESIGVPVNISFTTMDECQNHWPDDLGINPTSCINEDPTHLAAEEEHLHAMLHNVLGLEEEDLDNYFDPTLVSPTLKSKYTQAIPNKQHIARLEKYFAFRPPEVIRKTLARTTQLAKAVVRFPLRRHLKSRFQMLRWPRLNEVVATDTYFSSVKSIEGYYCSQVFYGLTSKKLHIEGMSTESHFPDAYMDFIRKNGIPHTLRRDNAKAERSERIKEIHRDLIIADQWTEPHSPWQNPAELHGVKYLKDHGQTLMNRTNTPENLWFLCHQYLVDVYNVCAHPQLNWQTPVQAQGGDTPDISHLLCFYWMEPVLYLDPNEKFPASKEKPGYFVGFAECTGDALTFKVLTEDMKVVLSRSVMRSASNPKHRNRRVKFRDEVEDNLDKAEDQEDYWKRHDNSRVEEQDEGEIASRTRSKVKQEVSPLQDVTPISERTRSRTSGTFKVAQQEPRRDWVKKLPTLIMFATFQIVNYMLNPAFYQDVPQQIHDQISCNECIDFENTTRSMSQNHNLWDQLRYVQALDMVNEEDEPENSLWNCKHVMKHRQVRRKGRIFHEVKCQWMDPNASLSWINMDALILQDPIPVIMYAKKMHIMDQEPFQQLVNYCSGDAPSYLAKTYKVKAKGATAKFKFGVQVPFGLKHAYQLDKENGDDQWQKAIQKELKQLNDYNTFRKLEPGEKPPPDYQKIPYHIVFDVKFDLRRKARLVAGGNWTNPGKEDLYSGVVGIESVRLGFFLGEQNGLSCCAADVGNAFLYGKTKEKVYIIAGNEFGPELRGCPLIIYKSLYGLRTSSARFHEHCAEKLRQLGFKPSKFDCDFWYKDVGSHYEYLATFVDDLLVWSKDPMSIIQELKETYILKGVGVPEYYLGGDVEILDQHWKDDGVGIALSAKTYIKNVIPKFELLFGETFHPVKTPMAEDYHPEIDDSPLLNDMDIAKFRSIIGSANWIITLGRFDINYATSALSRFNMAPREGHLKAAKRILGYLKTFPKGRTIFDISYPDHSKYPTTDHPNWKEFYPDAEEDIPIDIPIAKGKAIRITVYVDADHAHDLVTRRSITGILLLLNNTPFRFICKRQKTVETSTYGSELVAARVATDLILETRYMLRTIGAKIDGPALMLGDNMSVVLNTTVPSSVLKKKHCAISYHRVREAIAAKILRFAHVPSTENIADILTKPLPNKSFHYLIKKHLFRLPSNLESEKTTNKNNQD